MLVFCSGDSTAVPPMVPSDGYIVDSFACSDVSVEARSIKGAGSPVPMAIFLCGSNSMLVFCSGDSTALPPMIPSAGYIVVSFAGTDGVVEARFIRDAG